MGLKKPVHLLQRRRFEQVVVVQQEHVRAAGRRNARIAGR
jgi:hypothetical protein